MYFLCNITLENDYDDDDDAAQALLLFMMLTTAVEVARSVTTTHRRIDFRSLSRSILALSKSSRWKALARLPSSSLIKYFQVFFIAFIVLE